jgi:hypothetical protein
LIGWPNGLLRGSSLKYQGCYIRKPFVQPIKTPETGARPVLVYCTILWVHVCAYARDIYTAATRGCRRHTAGTAGTVSLYRQKNWIKAACTRR